MLSHVTPHVITDPTDVPVCAAQQPLQQVGAEDDFEEVSRGLADRAP